MKKLLYSIFGIMLSISSFAQQFDTLFAGANPKMTFIILSEGFNTQTSIDGTYHTYRDRAKRTILNLDLADVYTDNMLILTKDVLSVDEGLSTYGGTQKNTAFGVSSNVLNLPRFLAITDYTDVMNYVHDHGVYNPASIVFICNKRGWYGGADMEQWNDADFNGVSMGLFEYYVSGTDTTFLDSNSFKNALRHELFHSFAHLADTYMEDESTCTVSSVLQTQADTVAWDSLINISRFGNEPLWTSLGYRTKNLSNCTSEWFIPEDTTVSPPTTLSIMQSLSGNLSRIEEIGVQDRIDHFVNANCIIVSKQSGNWADASTWLGGVVPALSNDVIIRKNHVISASNANCHQLDIEETAELTVTDKIKVDHKIHNDGSLYFTNNSSLLQVDNASNTGNGTNSMERIGNTHLLRYNTWSSPVSAAYTKQGVFANANPCDMYTIENSTQSWKYDFPNPFTSVCITNPVTFTAAHQNNDLVSDGIMDVAVGYFIPGNDTDPKRIFTGGNFNNGPFQYMVYSGENIAGNPYPSAIDISAFLLENQSVLTTQAIYFWDQTDYAVVNATGIVGGQNGVNTHPTPSTTITSAQGFSLYTTNSGAVNFNNSMRVQGNNDIFYKKESTENYTLEMTLGKEKHYTLIGFKDEATFASDPAYDAQDFRNRAKLSSLIGSERYLIQGLPTGLDEVWVNMKGLAGATVSLPKSNTYSIFIEQNGQLYTENHQLTDENFRVLFTKKAATVYAESSTIQYYNGLIEWQKGEDLTVYDLMGRLVYEGNEGNYSLTHGGVYIIQKGEEILKVIR